MRYFLEIICERERKASLARKKKNYKSFYDLFAQFLLAEKCLFKDPKSAT